MPTIYVSDWRLHCVWQLNGLADRAHGQLSVGGGVGQFDMPCDLAFDSEGRVDVPDRDNHRIVRATTAQDEPDGGDLPPQVARGLWATQALPAEPLDLDGTSAGSRRAERAGTEPWSWRAHSLPAGHRASHLYAVRTAPRRQGGVLDPPHMALASCR